MNKRIAAIAALGIFAISVPSVQAAPRSKASISKAKASAAKRKAAAEAAKAAAAETARLAAIAAEEARARAQWGLLATLGDSDFELRNVPVTLRRFDGGNSVEMTSWSSFGRSVSRITRDPATGGLSFIPAKGAPVPLKALADGTLEASNAQGVRWPFAKRLATGEVEWMATPGAVGALRPMSPSGKAAAKLAALVAKGKVTAVGAPALAQGNKAQSPAGAVGSAQMAGTSNAAIPASVAKLSWEDKAALLAPGQAIARETSKEDRGDSFIWRNPCFRLDVQPGKTYMVRGEFGGEINYVSVKKGCGSTSKIFAMSDEEGNRSDRTSVFTAGDDRLYADVPMRGSGRKFRISLRELTATELAQYRTDRNAVKTAQQQAKQSSGGNSGWLGGLIMGGVAAAAGGDAGMVMGAAMKGVEMTTDNEMSRNVLAGQGDAMIQSSIDVQNQKAELERLRIAAEAETRRNQQASATGRSAANSPASAVAPASNSTATKVAERLPAASKPTASSSSMVRYSFCTDGRTDRSTGRIREVIYYSPIGTIRPGPDGGISFPTGFADYVDTQTTLKRNAMSENCPLFESVARAEQDLAIKRQIERPGIRDFVYMPNFTPR